MLRRLTRGGLLIWVLLVLTATSGGADEARPWVVYEGQDGPGRGKHIVLISGDDEYRSEEALPMLGKILAVRHGFKCTVLFAIDPETGAIKPDHQTNIPGTEALNDADMMVLGLRFRDLPDTQMAPIAKFVESGKPILGLRTSTHAFNFTRNTSSPYVKYSFNSRDWPGGFGQQVLGDTWINHHGNHGSQSTRGIISTEHQDHPILRGVQDVWGPTDVYGIRNLPDNAQVLLYGEVVDGMEPNDPPVAGEKNDPMMPVFWVRHYGNKNARIICTTMGASVDLLNQGVATHVCERLLLGLGMEDQITDATNVDLVGEYRPTPFGFGTYQKGVMPAEHALP